MKLCIFEKQQLRFFMNFLAHIHLSGNNDWITIGNFMADGIRGKQYESYPAAIQKGILLHRAIDSFTDAHPLFRQGTKRLHSRYHHYAGVLVDMYYDHFLAKNWLCYSNENLADYSLRFYQMLHDHFELLSPKAQQILPYMEAQNWLLNYQTIEGLEKILIQMDQRTKNVSQMRFATEELVKNYNPFEQEFSLFYKDLQHFTTQKITEL